MEELLQQFNPVLKSIFGGLGSPSKNLQIGSAMCLTKLVQNAPVLALQATLSYVSTKLLEILGSSFCKSHTQILEAIISLVLAVE